MELAQVNVAVQRASLRHRTMAGFVAAFDPVSRLAAESPGFVWHLRSDTGHTVRDEEGRQLVVNVTVWRDYPSLSLTRQFTPEGRPVSRGRSRSA